MYVGVTGLWPDIVKGYTVLLRQRKLRDYLKSQEAACQAETCSRVWYKILTCSTKLGLLTTFLNPQHTVRLVKTLQGKSDKMHAANSTVVLQI